MKKLLFVVCLFVSSSAFATTAFWTGNKEQLQSEKAEANKEQPQSEKAEANKEQPQSEKVETTWKCEYRVAYTTEMILIWRTFPDACPSEIDVTIGESAWPYYY
jgi:hypothetical protein